MKKIKLSTIILLIAVLSLLSSMVFIVDQRQYAILFGLGEIKAVLTKPGLHFKLPLPFQNVVFLDKRILTLDTPEADRFITAEKKNIVVDSFIKWKIIDPKLYFVSFGGDEVHAQDRLLQLVKSALNEEITKQNVRNVIAGERSAVMEKVREKTADETRLMGIEVVDVRLKRVAYVEEINNSVYDRMRAERLRVANELRSTGSAESEKIRAEADKQRTVILAEAYRDAEKIRGEGDAKASRIYADAFSLDPAFYRFNRSLEAYRASFKNKTDVMVLDTNSDFFQYFKSPHSDSVKRAAK